MKHKSEKPIQGADALSWRDLLLF